MAFDIIIGRSESDRKKYGKRGTIFLGKQYVKMGRTTSLSNNIYLEISRAHVIFVCGKRGSGKSYTMGVVAEGLADMETEIAQNLSIIMLDTMGVYWTMKYPNKKDEILLKEWGLEGKPLNIKIYTPIKFYEENKKEGIPTDASFSIKASELNASDWCLSFGIKETDAVGVLIERIVDELEEEKGDFNIKDILEAIKNDKKSEPLIKNAAENRFLAAEDWGVFSNEGTDIKELSKGGQITILDVSSYATQADGWKIKSLVIGLIAKKLFIQRMIARKKEEYKAVQSALKHYEESEREKKEKSPLIWLVIDEAHEFLPNQGETTATESLITVLREGRQPGISLILASQQPGKIHTDVMTQSDTVISHRITAKVDIEALGMLMQSYMREGLDMQLNNLPSTMGSAIIFDDINERLYPMRVRPRFTWHGGGAPIAVKEKKEEEI